MIRSALVASIVAALPGCSSPPRSLTVLESPAVRVVATVESGRDRWAVRDAHATSSGRKMLELRVVAFLDANGNDALDPGEGKKTWRVDAFIHRCRGFARCLHTLRMPWPTSPTTKAIRTRSGLTT